MTMGDTIFWIFIISLLVFNTRVQQSIKAFIVFISELIVGGNK